MFDENRSCTCQKLQCRSIREKSKAILTLAETSSNVSPSEIEILRRYSGTLLQFKRAAGLRGVAIEKVELFKEEMHRTSNSYFHIAYGHYRPECFDPTGNNLLLTTNESPDMHDVRGRKYLASNPMFAPFVKGNKRWYNVYC